MTVEIRQLRKFIAVAAQKNFTRAAELLHIAQPALSKQILQLEEQLGVQLIQRNSRPIKLTVAGQRFYEDALSVIDRVERMEASVRRLGVASKRSLTVAFSQTAIYGGLSDVMKGLALARPDLEVRWMEMASSEHADALRKGIVDIGFGSSQRGERDLQRVLLREERLFVAMAKDDSLAAERGAIQLAELDGKSLVIYPVDAQLSAEDSALGMLRVAGVRPVEFHEVKELDTALALVAAGSGLCLVPATSRGLRSDVAYRMVADEDAILPVVMCYRLQEDDSLIETIKDVIRTFFAEKPPALDPAYNRIHSF